MRQSLVLITGGNDGIGRATARILLERGCRVLIAGRNEQKLRAAVAALAYQSGNDAVDYIHFDLADLASIRAAALRFREAYDHLDVLINNAGIFTDQWALSAQGVELQLAVNHLGPFLLTHLLLPSLQAATAPRIINVASVAHYQAKLVVAELNKTGDGQAYDGLAAYARSKLANVLFTLELARRYPAISSNCLHPGVVRTRIANKNCSWYWSLLWSLYKPFMRAPHCGARTSVYLALSPELRGVSGRYFDERQCCRKPAPQARDEVLARELWQWSMQQCAAYL
ncbi:MAG: SDR family oxidoreductase [Bacteroidetes bacterium]|nr:MAG: SDR family oxidoreductase [Bacteroidota bacterium]